jgi:hypothetical protein
MPRDPRNRRLPAIPTNSLVASTLRFGGGSKVERIYMPVQDWQRECYRHFTICGEARFAARFFGNALSRCTLGVGKAKPGGIIDAEAGSNKAKVRLDELFNGSNGQSQMLAAAGVHLTIAGEFWLVGREVEGVDTWEVVSVLEMNVNGERWTIAYDDGKPPVELDLGRNGKPGKDVAIRVWLPNPAKRIEADSPFRSLLPVLGEVEWLTKHIFAQARSRLATAGIFPIPSETTFPKPPPKEGEETQAEGTTSDLDVFMKMLADAMSASLADQGNPASLVPILLKMPGEHIDKLKLVEFWSKLDAAAQTMRSNALSRFFLGMDLPPEQMSGMSSNLGTGGGRTTGVSHWGAWQIEEQTIKMHVEPMLEVLSNAVTLSYLRPLTGDNTDVITYSTEKLRLRPDRSEQAILLNNMGILKDEVTAKENGFKPEDIMSDDERKQWLLRKIASGSATPEQVAAALAQLGVQVPGVQNSEPRESRPAPSLERLPDPPRDPSQNGLLYASEALVLRALEKAGNRIRQKGVKIEGVPSHAMHTVHACNGTADDYLAGAWSTAPIVLDGLADTEKVIPVLHSYCRSLFTEQAPHSRERLARFLEVAQC